MNAYEKQIRQVDSARDLDVLMPMYNLIEYSGYYSKTSRSVRQYYRDEPNNILTNSQSFVSKIKITRKITPAGNIKNVEIAERFKYISNFWGTLQTP